MNIIQLAKDGIVLEDNNNKGLFKWEKIKYVNVGEIDLGYVTGECKKLIDLIYSITPNIIKTIRVQEEKIKYQLIFKNIEDGRSQNFKRLIKILLKYSNSRALTDKKIQEACSSFHKYKDIKSYESNIISTLIPSKN